MATFGGTTSNMGGTGAAGGTAPDMIISDGGVISSGANTGTGANIPFADALQISPHWWLLILGAAVLVVTFWFLHQSKHLHTWLRNLPQPAPTPDEQAQRPPSPLVLLPQFDSGIAVCYGFTLFVALALVTYMSAAVGYFGDVWFLRTLFWNLPGTIFRYPETVAPALFLASIPAALVSIFNFGTAVMIAQVITPSSETNTKVLPTSIIGAIMSAMSLVASAIVLWARLHSI